MEKTVAVCGLVCSECPAFLATVNEDDEKRRETAELWSEQYGMELKTEDINCRGCLSGGDEIIGYCRVCEIRKCGLNRGVANCAHCREYVCEKLEPFFQMVPEAKKALDEIKSTL